MSVRLSGGVYLVSATELQGSDEKSGKNDTNIQQTHNNPTKSMTIVSGPQRSTSLDFLNFEEKRQLIASSLSLSDFLTHGPAVAAAAAKEVAANTVIIGKKQNGLALRAHSLELGSAQPTLERKSKLSALGRLFKPWKWKRKKKSDKFEAASRTLERKISVRAKREELVQKGILFPDNLDSSSPASDFSIEREIDTERIPPQQEKQPTERDPNGTPAVDQVSAGSQLYSAINNPYSSCSGTITNPSSPQPSPLYPEMSSSKQMNEGTLKKFYRKYVKII